MAGLPTFQVLLDDGIGGYPYDITSKVLLMSPGLAVTRGRQDELSDVSPGTLSLVLNNDDGRFTAGSTIIATPSPIRPDVRIRVKETANAVTVNRFTGYMQGLPVSWPGGKTRSLVQLTAVDGQARAERRILRQLSDEVIFATPTIPNWMFKLNEEAGAVSAGDTSLNQVSPLVIAGGGTTSPAFGVDLSGPFHVLDEGTGVQFTSGGKYLSAAVPYGHGYGPGFGGCTYMCIFLTTSVTGANLIDGVFSMNTAGQVVCSAGGGITTPGAYNIGQPQIATLTDDTTTAKFYLSGGLVGSAPSVTANLRTLNVGGSPAAGVPGSVALRTVLRLPTALSAAQVANITNFLAGASGESASAQIARIAGFAGLPTGTIDTSFTSIDRTNASVTGKSAAEAIKEDVDAEMGLAFIDGSGNLTLHGRNRPALKTTPDLTVPVSALSEDTAVIVDMQGVINYLEVTTTQTGAVQVVSNGTSEASHGRYPSSETYLVTTDAEALDRANWIVGNHAEPLPRVGTLKIDLLTMTAAQQQAALAIEPNTWVRITGLPAQTPGGTTADLMVQGWSETLTATEWSLTLNVVARSMFQAWILGDATFGVLDSTTRLYV